MKKDYLLSTLLLVAWSPFTITQSIEHHQVVNKSSVAESHNHHIFANHALHPGNVTGLNENEVHHSSQAPIIAHQDADAPAPVPQPHRDVCPNEAKCVAPVQCPAHVRIKDAKQCRTLGERTGICCTTGGNHTDNSHKKTGKDRHVITLDPDTLGQITRHTRVEISNLRARESKLLRHGPTVLTPGSASYGHFRNSRMFNEDDLNEVFNVANRALEIAIATRAFKDRQEISNDQLETGINHDLRMTPLGSSCANRPFCTHIPDKYRRIDGGCNNFFNTGWGIPMTPYARLLPPSYKDGIWVPRVSEIEGVDLASPRLISSAIFPDRNVPSSQLTLLASQFGQYLSHEVTQSLDTSFVNGSAVSCCTPDGQRMLDPAFRHFACMPIPIPKNDPFFSDFGQGCMNFVRSVLAPRFDCTLGFAQQMNKVTHFIDGSTIYGSTVEQTEELRAFEGGLLKVFHDFGRDLLPLSRDKDACLTMEEGSACFSSGDTRTNQMVSLVAIHTLFMREHNRIAKVLGHLNPDWTDEKVFLEARQIVIAELQVIVYKEYVPALVGESAMQEFQLNLQEGSNYAFDYDPNVEPSVTNEFAAAAFRFGHSTVDGLLKMYGVTKVEEFISIPEVMFHPARMRKRVFMDELLSTLTTEPMQEVDNSLSETLTKYLFRAGNPFGVDLASLNIQRGRDHGLRPYNDYRNLVGLPKIRSFDEFGPEIAKALSSVYRSVNDVDLWVGGLLEPKYPGSVVGPVFRDIIADQFVRLKRGDKYFFENDPSVNPGHFRPDQLAELRKTSMARIICDNSDGILIARQPPNAFRVQGPGNGFVDCASNAIPRVNLKLWQE